MFLISSFIVFAVFFVNVAMGAFGDASFLGDVGEMVVLFIASVLFVVAILKKEAARNRDDAE
ncbi:hypothetical protein L0664_15200 [Octadecabacter sp. G9-8]|uniref:DUF1328 domain-containing protein n=1 Tax=Octadecabacter dasysiphoniae TaxID=2909341 RepID=A0ABS9CYQ5_9RHOB|nr:hypothetical protein [Octadecabacter dasysiphoniae]MCF2872420.1 hypothetical protein [Octadecabacter dasysiphoniae]